MAGEPQPRGFGALIVAKVACCGGLVLVATGALSLNAIAAWLADGGPVWLALAAVLAVSGVSIWRWRAGVRKAGSAAPRPKNARGAPAAGRVGAR